MFSLTNNWCEILRVIWIQENVKCVSLRKNGDFFLEILRRQTSLLLISQEIIFHLTFWRYFCTSSCPVKSIQFRKWLSASPLRIKIYSRTFHSSVISILTVRVCDIYVWCLSSLVSLFSDRKKLMCFILFSNFFFILLRSYPLKQCNLIFLSHPSTTILSVCVASRVTLRQCSPLNLTAIKCYVLQYIIFASLE